MNVPEIRQRLYEIEQAISKAECIDNLPALELLYPLAADCRKEIEKLSV